MCACAASWFASDAVRDAFVPVLDRPYEPERAGVTEAAIERGSPVRIERIEDWPGASGLHDRLFERLDADRAERLWDWYSSSSFLSCPVRTRDGRILGVLAIARSASRRSNSRSCRPTAPGQSSIRSIRTGLPVSTAASVTPARSGSYGRSSTGTNRPSGSRDGALLRRGAHVRLRPAGS